MQENLIWLITLVWGGMQRYRDADDALCVVKELELGFNKLSDNNVNLRKEKGELGSQLRACTAEKAALVKEIERLNRTEQFLRGRLVSGHHKSGKCALSLCYDAFTTHYFFCIYSFPVRDPPLQRRRSNDVQLCPSILLQSILTVRVT